MLRLTDLRVVNWHGYQDEHVRFEKNTVITGQNGAGKTTLIDAIQYCLVADQRVAKFNKANQTSRRTLAGYARWHVSAEETGKAKGRGTYHRGACTTYIAVRFEDDAQPPAAFACAVIIEAGESESILSQHFLIATDIRLEELPFVRNDVPLSSLEFRRLAADLGLKTIPDAQTYRAHLRQRLGHLPESFHRMVVKALDFKPIGEVRQFIRDYLLEERPLQTESLLRNVENYQRLEAEAADAVLRIEALNEILGIYGDFERVTDEHASMEYIILRAKAEEANTKAAELEDDINRRWDNVAELEREAKSSEIRARQARDDLEKFFIAISGAPEEIQRNSLQKELNAITTEVEEAEKADQEARLTLTVMGRAFTLVQSQRALDARKAAPNAFDQDPFADGARLQRCREFIEGAVDPDGRRARSWRTALTDAREVYGNAKRVVRKRIEDLREGASDLNRERSHLERGQVTYTREVEALLHLLNGKLDLDPPIRPLCEQIEMKDHAWTDAAEGMLGQDRFSLVVPPDLYEKAVGFYRRFKDGYSLPGRGTVELHSVKVLDMRGVVRDVRGGRGQRPGSLAAQIDAANELARAYVDYRLGDVICVQRDGDLRQHARAVTPDVMVHQGHGTWRMPPNSFARRFIGLASHQHRIAQIAAEVVSLQDEIDRLEPAQSYAEEADRLCDDSRVKLDSYLEVAAKATKLPEKKRREAEIRRQIETLDQNPEVRKRAAERQRLDTTITTNEATEKRAGNEASGLRIGIEKDGEKVIEFWSAAEVFEHHLQARFATTDLERIRGYSDRYEDRRGRGESPADLVAVYDNQRKNRETQLRNLEKDLVRLQTTYRDKYGMEAPDDPTDVSTYRAEVMRWVESRLPDKQAEIEKVRDEARKQLAQDYIYRLYENFRMLAMEFDDVNSALRTEEANTHWGRYRLIWSPLTQYKATYDLIMSVGIAGLDSLFDTPEIRLELSKEFDELADSLLRSGVTGMEDSVLNDYREFFDYDLILRRPDGTEESFKNVTGGGSGGENQVPYYIAILASMFQMYRHTRRDGRPSCGTVLLDEAFSKMDEPRIEAVLGLARHLKLQLILVTPGDKVTTIVPRVETTILIERDQNRNDAIPTARRFNKDHLDLIVDALGEEAFTASVA